MTLIFPRLMPVLADSAGHHSGPVELPDMIARNALTAEEFDARRALRCRANITLRCIS